MLQTIHDKLKGWVAGLVLGAIGLVFVFWGINWTMTAPNYAAKVNGSEIAGSEVRQSYLRELAQLERQTKGSIDESERSEIKRRVLEEYVNSEAVVTRADALGYRVSDADLLREMAKVQAFQVDGKFDRAHAVAVLKAQGRSVAEIEGLFRRDVKLQQLDRALSESSFATPGEVRRLRALLDEQREISWFAVPVAKYSADAVASDAELKAYYDAHLSEYMTPETVHLRYVEISLSTLESQVTVDDAKLKAYYDEQKAKTPERYTQPERRRVRHILLQVGDPKEDATVKAKAEGLLKRAEGGEDFSKLAREFSQDTGSAKQGGDLGWSERKVWVPAFADAAFGMQVGEIRGPVKTQFGYHILKLDGIEPATVRSFDQARSDLEAEYRRNEADRLFNAAQDKLADAALQNSTDLDVVARKAGLTVHDVPGFSRSDGGGDFGKSMPVIDAAFSPDVLDGHLSPIIEVDKGRGVVLRSDDHQLPQQKPLAAVRSEVAAAWKQQRGAQLAAAAAAEAVKRLTAGEPWEAVAKSLGAVPQPPKFVSRNDPALPVDTRRAAFEAPTPTGKPVYERVALDNGDVDVLAVTAVREDPTSTGPEQQAQFRRQVAQQSASAEAQSYAMAARAAAKVVMNLQALD